MLQSGKTWKHHENWKNDHKKQLVRWRREWSDRRVLWSRSTAAREASIHFVQKIADSCATRQGDDPLLMTTAKKAKKRRVFEISRARSRTAAHFYTVWPIGLIVTVAEREHIFMFNFSSSIIIYWDHDTYTDWEIFTLLTGSSEDEECWLLREAHNEIRQSSVERKFHFERLCFFLMEKTVNFFKSTFSIRWNQHIFLDAAVAAALMGVIRVDCELPIWSHRVHCWRALISRPSGVRWWKLID